MSADRIGSFLRDSYDCPYDRGDDSRHGDDRRKIAAKARDGQADLGPAQPALGRHWPSPGRGGAGRGGASGAGTPEWRQLSFRTSGLTIELEITCSGDHRRLIGQLIPRQAALVEIRHADGVTTAEADVLGRFSAEIVPLGQISLRCRLGTETDQSPVITGWITI